MLSMGGAPDHGAIGGNSSFGRIDPGTISTRSIGRYRAVLEPEAIASIQMSCGRNMKDYGYFAGPTGMSRRERAAFMIKDFPLTSIRIAGWITIDRINERRGRTVPERRLADVNR
jgi:hypothetical protein